mgnify:CR=1 FL=1
MNGQFSNLLHFVPHHAALSSLRSSGRLTRDIREIPRLGISPNFAPFHSAKLRISLTLGRNFDYFLLFYKKMVALKIGETIVTTKRCEWLVARERDKVVRILKVGVHVGLILFFRAALPQVQRSIDAHKPLFAVRALPIYRTACLVFPLHFFTTITHIQSFCS